MAVSVAVCEIFGVKEWRDLERSLKMAPFDRPYAPGDAPGAITLNVVWMEREFDAYKLSRCMCPSKYNRF